MAEKDFPSKDGVTLQSYADAISFYKAFLVNSFNNGDLPSVKHSDMFFATACLELAVRVLPDYYEDDAWNDIMESFKQPNLRDKIADEEKVSIN